MKGLINLKNKDHKCFMLCHVRLEDRFQMQVNVFRYENKVYPLYISKKSYNKTLNLLLILKKTNHTMCLLKILTD